MPTEFDAAEPRPLHMDTSRDTGTPAVSTHKDFLRSLLNKRLRVAIKDGRVIEGSFLCTDRERNLVLGSCEEYLTQKDVGERGVLVPSF